MTWEQEHALACVKNAQEWIARAQEWIAQGNNDVRTQRPLAHAYNHLNTARLVLEESKP